MNKKKNFSHDPIKTKKFSERQLNNTITRHIIYEYILDIFFKFSRIKKANTQTNEETYPQPHFILYIFFLFGYAERQRYSQSHTLRSKHNKQQQNQ